MPISGLDPALDGLRIAHLSDLHVGSLTPHRFIRAAVEMAQAEQPDLVAMTGDYVCYSPRFVPQLGELTQGFTVPTICVITSTVSVRFCTRVARCTALEG